MIIFFEDMEITRYIPARIASYSLSLLDTRKSKRNACFILSPVGALSYKQHRLLFIGKCHPY